MKAEHLQLYKAVAESHSDERLLARLSKELKSFKKATGSAASMQADHRSYGLGRLRLVRKRQAREPDLEDQTRAIDIAAVSCSTKGNYRLFSKDIPPPSSLLFRTQILIGDPRSPD